MPGANTSHVVHSGSPMLPDVPQRDDDGEDQPAVEHAAGARERQQLARVGGERPEVGDQQQQLRADQRADDDVDAEVEDAVRRRGRAPWRATIASFRPSR